MGGGGKKIFTQGKKLKEKGKRLPKIARGVLPYISYIGMCYPKGMTFGPFWPENRYTLCPFWSGNRYGFRANYWKHMNVFIISIPNE